MAALTISDNDGTATYSVGGTPSAGPFSIDFVFFDVSEIHVSVTTAAGVTTELPAADFTVSGTAADDGYSGGSVTLDVAVSNSDVTVWREMLIEKAVNLGTTGQLNVRRLNTQISRLYAQLQDIQRQVDLSLKLPPADVAMETEFGSATLRASKYAGFDADGNPSLIAGEADASVSVAMAPVVSAATLGAARTAMAVPGLGANTFTAAQTVAGNAAADLELTPRQQVPTTIRIQNFAASGTYTPHAKMLFCIVEAVGGGGGGGGTATASAGNGAGGGGGGAGGYSRKLCTAADIGASKAVTIGAAGAAGTAGNNAGGNGGDTSLGVLCVAKGGTGGGGCDGTVSGTGGAGGVAGTGDLALVGPPGEAQRTVPSSRGKGGSGASSAFGGGAISPVTPTATAGNAGTGKGAGGSGGASYDGNGAAAGGAGAIGYLIVTEFCSA